MADQKSNHQPVNPSGRLTLDAPVPDNAGAFGANGPPLKTAALGSNGYRRIEGGFNGAPLQRGTKGAQPVSAAPQPAAATPATPAPLPSPPAPPPAGE